MPLDQVHISPLDRGFLFGDGVFELIPSYGKQLFRPQQHIQRLLNSLESIYLPSPYDAQHWLNLLQQLVALNPQQNQTLYLQVTRGVEAKRDHAIKAETQPTVFIMSTAMDKPSLSSLDTEQGIDAITHQDSRWQHCNIKSNSMLGNILLRHQSTLQGASETILIRDGKVTEGTSSNVFVLTEGCLATPPLSQYLLGGVTRDLILELAQQNHIPVVQENLSESQLFSAQEVWITSSSVGIRPVVRLDRQVIADGNPGQLWRKLAKCFIEYRHSLMA